MLPEMQIESVFLFGLQLWRIDIGIIVLQDMEEARSKLRGMRSLLRFTAMGCFFNDVYE